MLLLIRCSLRSRIYFELKRRMTYKRNNNTGGQPPPPQMENQGPGRRQKGEREAKEI